MKTAVFFSSIMVMFQDKKVLTYRVTYWNMYEEIMWCLGVALNEQWDGGRWGYRVATCWPMWWETAFIMLILYSAYDWNVPCACECAKRLQSCLALCDPVDCSLPGSSVHGILQARTLEWVATPSSGTFPTQRSNLRLLGLLPWRHVVYHQRHQGRLKCPTVKW